MADVVTTSVRSRMMSGIRGKDTQPELIVRKFLHAKGLRYRLHVKNLPGKPDIVLPKYKTVVFVHGCFWHQHTNCKYAAKPNTRPDFWEKKLSENVARDQYQMAALQGLGWQVIVVWECEISRLGYLDQFLSNITHR